MGDLLSSRELDVNLGAPEYDVLIMNPNEGRRINLWESERTFHLYREMDPFIQASDDYIEVSLRQENDCDRGVVVIKNRLKKEIGHPDRGKLFRKNDNLFLKPAD